MGLTGRITNAFRILGMSFSFLARDKSLMIIPVLMLISAILMIIPFLAVFILRSIIAPAFFVLGLILVFLSTLWFTFLGAAHVWMVHEVAEGRNATLRSGLSRAWKNIGDVLFYALAMMVVRSIMSQMRKKGGHIGRATSGIIGTLAGVAGSLVLPAMIVTDRTFKESVVQLRDSLKAWPEIATYALGIGPVTAIIFMLGFLLTFIIAVSGPILMAALFFIIWMIMMILLSKFVNYTYYTLLYITVIEGRKIEGIEISK